MRPLPGLERGEVDGLDERPDGVECPPELGFRRIVHQQAHDAAEHGMRVTERALDFSRLEPLRPAGAGQQHRVRADLGEGVGYLVGRALAEQGIADLTGRLRDLGLRVVELVTDSRSQERAERREPNSQLVEIAWGYRLPGQELGDELEQRSSLCEHVLSRQLVIGKGHDLPHLLA